MIRKLREFADNGNKSFIFSLGIIMIFAGVLMLILFLICPLLEPFLMTIMCFATGTLFCYCAVTCDHEDTPPALVRAVSLNEKGEEVIRAIYIRDSPSSESREIPIDSYENAKAALEEIRSLRNKGAIPPSLCENVRDEILEYLRRIGVGEEQRKKLAEPAVGPLFSALRPVVYKDTEDFLWADADLYSRFLRLKELYEDDLITEEEYEEKKADLLAEL